MKPPAELAPSRKERRVQAQKIFDQHSEFRNMAPVPALSSLEMLPVEIIQHIFFDSLEVNLANTSLTLNRALSQEAIYHALILFAYFDDDGHHPVETRHFRPAQFRRTSLEDRVKLQIGILKCKWCSLDRIHACMPALSRLKMVQEWHQERNYEQEKYQRLLRGSDRAPKEIIRVPYERPILDIAPLPELDDDAAMQQHFSSKISSQYWELRPEVAANLVGPTSPEGFLPFMQCWEYYPSPEDNSDGLVYKIIGCAAGILGVMVIPDKLLEGNPWTDNRVSFLQLLRQGIRYKKHSEYLLIRASAMMRGMESAIHEGNSDVLRVLIELHDRIAGLYQDAPELDRNYERITTSDLDSNPSLDALPARLFHLASKQGPAGSALLSLLIRASWRSIHPDDPVLTGWALRAEASGDRLGKWLKKYMEGAYGDDFRSRPVFINGAVSWRLREGDYPFPEESFTAEIGYIHDHAPDEPVRPWPV
jgi:hypothetical protein